MSLVPKPMDWDSNHIAKFMGITFAVINNEHNTHTAVMFIPNKRPEIETSFNSIEQAKDWCEKVLLPMALNQYFKGNITNE